MNRLSIKNHLLNVTWAYTLSYYCSSKREGKERKKKPWISYTVKKKADEEEGKYQEALSHFYAHSCHDHENDNKKWTSQFKRKLKRWKKKHKNFLIHFI